MSFSYDREKNKDRENFWTSYADLYTTLFTIFLFIYVASSLRQGTKTVEQVQDKKYLTHQIDDLKQQLKVYEALKDEQLKNKQQSEDTQLYDELIGKLDLLKEESKNEKEALRTKELEADRKEKALNKYQQLVRNMINSNILAKSKIQKRNETIDKQDVQLQTNQDAISSLEQNVANQKTVIASRESQIEQANQELENRINDLRKANRNQQLSQANMNAKIQKLKAESEANIAKLDGEARQAKMALSNTEGELKKTSQALAKAEETNEGLVDSLEKSKEIFENQMKGLRADKDGEIAKARKGFEDALNREHLAGTEKAQRAANLEKELGEKEKAFQNKMAGLQDKINNTNADLKRAMDKLGAQKKLAQQIRDQFKKAGIDVDINEKTGEVVLDFKDSHFDTGQYLLKKKMIEAIQKFIPIYASGLFKDEATANKIASVEIVGFASPTYKGKYVDPSSLNPDNSKAVNFNLDLSYQRGKSVFNYIFDTGKMNYTHQERLRSMAKVAARSFLAQSNAKDYCKINDCKKEQKVIIKFNLKD